MIKSPGKVLRQMYAHIYGRKHDEYLCPLQIPWMTNHFALTMSRVTGGKVLNGVIIL